jgi:hypothetical protein
MPKIHFFNKKTKYFCLYGQKQYLCKPFYQVLHQHARSVRYSESVQTIIN